MSHRIEQSLLEEASGILNRNILRDEELHDHFNINKLLLFTQRVHQRTGIVLNVNSFYLWTSIRELAGAVREGLHDEVPKLLKLRDGDRKRPLIVFAGGVSCFLELKSLLKTLAHDGVVYGMNLTYFDFPNSSPATVFDEIEACSEELKKQGIDGPVSLLGYSFGGILALELARRLRSEGKDVGFLGMIDTPQSEHTWPLPVWSGFLFHRIRRRLRKTSAGLRTGGGSQKRRHPEAGQQPPKSLLHRLKPLVFRFCRPTAGIYPELAPEWVDGHTPGYDRAGRQLLRMKGLYRPSVYDGELVYYRARGGSANDCDPRLIWRPYLPNAEWVDVRGNHLSVLVGKNGAALGEEISRHLRTERLAA